MKSLFEFLTNARSLLFPKRGLSTSSPPDNGATKVDEVTAAYTHGVFLGSTNSAEDIIRKLDEIPIERRCIAYEGAVTAKAMDAVRQNDWTSLASLKEKCDEFGLLFWVGFGGALAQSNARADIIVGQSDEFWSPAMLDGYGMHSAYFHWKGTVIDQQYPMSFSDRQCRLFDQGIGRALWYASSGSVRRLQQLIELFPLQRRIDMWHGVGVSMAHSGGVECSDMRRLRRSARASLSYLQQGVATAAKVRMEEHFIPDFTQGAFEIICNANINELMRLLDSEPPTDIKAGVKLLTWQDFVRRQITQ